MDERLDEVIRRGAPALAAAARRLQAALAADPDDPATRAAADALIDAYLNDPYLTRSTG